MFFVFAFYKDFSLGGVNDYVCQFSEKKKAIETAQTILRSDHRYIVQVTDGRLNIVLESDNSYLLENSFEDIVNQ